MLSIIALLATTPRLTIDFSTKGASLQRVLEVVQTSTGENVKCAPDLAQEPLILDVSNVDWAELRDRLAWVMDAEWAKTPEGWRLARTNTRKLQLREDFIMRRARAIAPELKKDADILAREPAAFDRARKAIEAFRQMSTGEKPTLPGQLVDLGTPASLLCRQAMVDMGAETLAALPLHQPVVFSDKPNSVEVPLPKVTQKAIKEFLDSQRWVASLANTDWKAANRIQNDWWKNLISEAAALSDHGKVLLICVAGEESFFTVLFEFNEQGQLCASANRVLNFASQEPPLDQPGNKKSISLSPIAAQMVGVMSRKVATVSEEAKRLIVNPTVSDPLSFAPAEAVWSARENGQMLVARLPDSAVRVAAKMTQRDQMDVTGFLQHISKDSDSEISTSNKWVLIRPRNSLLWEDVRLSRAALQKFFIGVTQSGVADLRTTSKLWHDAGSRAPLGSLWEDYRSLLPNLGVRDANFNLIPSLFRFIGALEDSIWHRLQRGEAIDVSALPRSQKDLFMSWCNGGYGRLEESGIGLVRRVPHLNPAQIPDLWLSGAEAMPQGIKPGVRFEVQTQPSYSIRRILGNDASLEYSLNQLIAETANQVYSQEGSTVTSVMTDKYLVGSQTQYLFIGRLRPEVEIRRTCGDVPDFGPVRSASPYAQLPKEFRVLFENLVMKAVKG